MKRFLGIEYGRGATKEIINGGPALAPKTVQKIFPNADWTFVTPAPFNYDECASDRFGENFKIQQKKILKNEKMIMLTGKIFLKYL